MDGYKGGWIEIIAGGMFSGKSEELIRRLRRSVIARQRVQSPVRSLPLAAVDLRAEERRVPRRRGQNRPRHVAHFAFSVEHVPIDAARAPG